MMNNLDRMSSSLIAAAEVDFAVGENVRRIRKLRKLSMSALGDAVGVTYQQIQKYEQGQNRISCAMVVRISAVFGCSISDLFDTLPGVPENSSRCQNLEAEDVVLAQAINHIRDPVVRQRLRDLIEALAACDGSP